MSSPAPMIGVINLDKPVGPTSHDMVGLARRLTGLRRIGHAGTLDPLASGVLPILVGPATRLSQELTGGPKRYDAVVRLGFRSQTDDGEGPIERGSEPPGEDAVRAVLPEFVGTFAQRPPAFSARKSGGVKAYQAAREGSTLDLPPREVTVHEIRMLDASPGDGWLDVRLDIETGTGTYVRSLARDLGERLGCGGYLHALRRTAAAGLLVKDSMSPEEVESLAAEGRIVEALIPPAKLLPYECIRLTDDEAERFTQGQFVTIPERAEGRVGVLRDFELIGIGEVHKWGPTLVSVKPVKVLVEGR